MLVVQERNGVFGGTGVWKMPTGVVNEVHSNLLDQIVKLQNYLFIYVLNF